MNPMSSVLRLVRRLYGWRWPLGWWRLRKRAIVSIAGQRISFAFATEAQSEWWALSARAKRWEPGVVDAFARAVRPGDVVYDVGAWIGPYTLLASKLAGPSGRVIAFEPDPVARAQLEHNVLLNEAANVKVLPIALTDHPGTAKLAGGGSEAVVGELGDVDVQTMTLPEAIAREGEPDVVKVDIEGGELALDVTALGRTRDIFIEVHVPAFRTAQADPDDYLSKIAEGRSVIRLHGDLDNYNVRIG